METRRENRSVSMIVASGLLTRGTRLPRARPTEPHARAPPGHAAELRALLTRLASAASPQTAREDLPLRKAVNGERRCYNIASPDRRTLEASPVTASYNTPGINSLLPLFPPIWQIQIIGTSQQQVAWSLRSPALIIHGEPVRRPHACPN